MRNQTAGLSRECFLLLYENGRNSTRHSVKIHTESEREMEIEKLLCAATSDDKITFFAVACQNERYAIFIMMS